MRTFLFGLIASALAIPAWAGTQLTFDVVSHTEAARGAKQSKGQSLPSDATYPLTATLAGDTLLIEQPETETRYDFKGGRVVELDKRKKSYKEFSLYTILGFNVAEFANRMMLGKMLAAAKIGDNPMAPALTEHLMSLSDPANATVIAHTTRGEDTVYSWNGQPLMTVSRKTRELPAAALKQYLRFLRYSTGGHPQILTAIESGKGVPERLTVVRSNMAVETRTLTLRSIDERPDSPLTLEGYTRELPDGEPFATLKRLPASPAAELEARAAVLRQQRDAAVADGHILDAMLANLAVVLSTGDQSEGGAWVAAHRAQINADADAQSLVRNVEPRDADSAKAAVDTFEKMSHSAGPHSYVINIFEGNIRFGLHQGPRATDLLLAALGAEPTITGAWVDLGSMYYRNFRADAAWACWDAARALRPGYSTLKTVDDQERKLRTDHPEFF